jgi:Mn-dependent DtxR family transcriptional regulator
MKLGWLQELSWRYIEKLYELSEGGLHPEVNITQVHSELGCSREEARSVHQYLESKGLISWKCRVMHVRITPRGIDEVERIMAETYRSKERRVLQKLYDERERRYTNPHQPEELARELNLDLREVQDIVIELESKGLTDGNDQSTWIIAAGLLEIESGGQRTGAASTTINYTANIGTNYGNLDQGGRGNTQSVTLTNNPDFERTLTGLIELLRASDISQLDKDDIIHDVERVKQLAQQNDTPGALERAQKKLDAVKTGIEVADSGGELLGKALPYITALWQLLTTLNS